MLTVLFKLSFMIFHYNHQLLSKHIKGDYKGAYKGQLAAGGVLVCCQLLIALHGLAKLLPACNSRLQLSNGSHWWSRHLFHRFVSKLEFQT